jgi:hypothetical protein
MTAPAFAGGGVGPPTYQDFSGPGGLLRLEDDTELKTVTDMISEAIADIETYIKRVIWDTVPPSRVFGAARAAFPVIQSQRISDDAPSVRMLSSGTDDFGRITNLPSPGAPQADPPLSSLPDFAPRLEQVCRRAVKDLVVEYYEHRNSLISIESAGGGATRSYGRQVHGMPARIRATLKPIMDLSQFSS